MLRRSQRLRLTWALALLGGLAVAALGAWHVGRGRLPAVASRGIRGQATVATRVAQYGPAVRARLAPAFARCASTYPPARVTLVGLKAERRLEVWVADATGPWRHLKDYPILGLSGALGPKLREGDRQVPEGLYRVEALNPNSRYHLALRVNYPNADERRRAAAEGRIQPGSDIMIHGNTCSVGCLAMGDAAAEDLFVLAAETGPDKVAIILSPVDFRVQPGPPASPTLPGWTPELYASLRSALQKLPRPAAGP